MYINIFKLEIWPILQLLKREQEQNKNRSMSVDDTDKGSAAYQQLLKENQKMRQQVRFLNSILENAPILISAKDLKGNILFTNAHFSVLQGPEPHEYIDKNVYELFPKEIADQLWQNDLKAQQSEMPIEAEELVHHKDDSLHTYHTTKFRLKDETEELIGTCAVSFDISHLKKLEQEATHDHLTGLYNRRYLEASLDREIARSARLDSGFVFALMDLDGFKEVNDHYGHQLGDEVLKATAKTLEAKLNRPSDFSYRFGGDEFAATFQTKSTDHARRLMESLREAVNEAIAAIVPGADEQCQVSIGYRVVEVGESSSAQQLYQEADKALYRAKEQGKNLCVSFTPDKE